MEKFQISCSITNNFIHWTIWNLFISWWVVNSWEQYHFYFFTYAYHIITYIQFFIHQSQFFFNINIFFWDKCGKFLTYEFCSISALDTLNWMYPYFPTYRAKLFRNPLPFCLSLAANYSTLSLSLSSQIGTHRQCSAIQSTWVLIFLSAYFYFSNFLLGLNTFTPICLV